jgi:long-chain acyl-CoA synthetase
VAAHRHRGDALSAELVAEWDDVQPAIRSIKQQVALDEMEIAVTAAASISPDVLLDFHALGVPLCDMYGLSECCGVAGEVREPRPGTVGRPIPGVEVRIADDGEILVRTGGVFVGYLDDPERTAEALDPDGWLHTGDVGALDDDGDLSLTGRKKDLIITAGGKNVSPSNLEAALCSFPLIGAACALGEGRPFVSALVVLDPLVAPLWALAHGIDGSDVATLARDPEIRAEIERNVAAANERLARVEQIKRFTILDEAWLPDTDVMTATMKVKRHVVIHKYRETIDDLYSP